MGGISLIFKAGPRFFLGAKARSPHGPLGPFHTDPSIYATEARSGLRITWIGHATSIIEIDGVRILVDPVLKPELATHNNGTQNQLSIASYH